MSMLSMVIEPVVPFNGLDVLVAKDEGLFLEEGLDLQFAVPGPGDAYRTETGTLTQPATAQGRLQDRGEAAMFQG